MPKERLHLLLADHGLQLLASSTNLSVLSEAQKFAYFLGAISPDALFYELPSFRYWSLGASLHQLEGWRCLAFFEPIFKRGSEDLTPETAAWLLGMASHFGMDGCWHPLIERLSDPDSSLCRELELTGRDCHYWLESEIEGYWLARIGPPDGYLSLVRQFAGSSRTRENCIKAFRMFLMRMNLDQIPRESEISRCFFWQTTLIQQFSLPAWAKWRHVLLRLRPTRMAGALIVPANPGLALTAARRNRNKGLESLFRAEFLARSVISLATHLRSLAAYL